MQHSQIRSAHDAPVRSLGHALGALRAALLLNHSNGLAAKESHASSLPKLANLQGRRSPSGPSMHKDPIRALHGTKLRRITSALGIATEAASVGSIRRLLPQREELTTDAHGVLRPGRGTPQAQ
jgi:hypothetical protein